jgi:glyoxylase-like metal-dependent hydrolase (beta-lactamase superfamily II)
VRRQKTVIRAPTELAPGLYRLGTEQVNWYLLETGSGLLAIDAGFPKLADTLEQDLAKAGLSTDRVEAVVLTHSDGDHTGVARALQERGARVLIHEADEPSLRKPGPKGGDASLPKLLANLRRPEVRRILGHTIRYGGGRPTKIEGAETFKDGDGLPGGLTAVHTPGHTRGHCALLHRDRRVLFAGDALIDHELVTKGRGPQVMPRYTNIDTSQAVASLRAIEALDGEVDLLLFGHGEPWEGGIAAALRSARGDG